MTLAPSYYGLMYILGFLYGLWAIKKTQRYTLKEQEDLFLYVFFWVLLWGRLWYTLFYDLPDFITDPLNIIRVWKGWMSFHGGFLGVCLALFLFSKKYKLSLWRLADDIALIIPVGLFFGRIWNYLNKELLGFPYQWFLAVQTSHGSFFPSPLVEAFLEGLVIFFILHYITKRQQFSGQLASLFFILYGVFRTFVELFIRIPDVHIWYYFWFFTQGSFLSIPMIVVWGVMYYTLSKNIYATK